MSFLGLFSPWAREVQSRASQHCEPAFPWWTRCLCLPFHRSCFDVTGKLVQECPRPGGRFRSSCHAVCPLHLNDRRGGSLDEWAPDFRHSKRHKKRFSFLGVGLRELSFSPDSGSNSHPPFLVLNFNIHSNYLESCLKWRLGDSPQKFWPNRHRVGPCPRILILQSTLVSVLKPIPRSQLQNTPIQWFSTLAAVENFLGAFWKYWCLGPTPDPLHWNFWG